MSQLKLSANFLKVILISFLIISRGLAFDPLKSADERISQYRMREVIVQLKDQKGTPIKNSLIKVNMLQHQFLFGCNLYLFDQFPIYLFDQFPTLEQKQTYLKLWTQLFNYATVPFYFQRYQPAPEQTQEAQLREMVNFCLKNNIKIKGHPLVWHFPSGNPDWLPLEPKQVEKILKNRILELVSKFPEIDYWDVVNEPTVSWVFDTPVAKWENQEGPVPACKKALEWAKAGNPQAHLIINDYNVRFGYWSFIGIFSPKKTIKLIFDPIKRYPFSYHRFLSELKKSGGNFDAIGIQTHTHIVGKWSMSQLWRLCQRYGKLGLPLQFSEVTVISGEKRWILSPVPKDISDWESTPEGEKEQADYVEKFYTLLFSHPQVEAITWWDLTDYNAWMNAPAGLVRSDLSPKPAYNLLYHLIREKWWTKLDKATDSQGELRFRGFCGDYQLLIPDRAKPLHFTIDCKKPEAQLIEIKI